ncbi:MAG: heme-binding beta-barrel domain-containing protein [Gammaproteobacteria bacterium]|nr:heme-binding beta-barrel domain-containing protein [Gammaproteobacteria bacterium]MCF6229472.1 heme-binding beta-barrel domain-containing protein [Gammaproteobacteria bacterium]
MAHENDTDYGPLTGLIGTWQGDKGMDVAPEPDGPDNNPYYETITFEAAGDVDNAGEQFLSIVHYKQVVQRKSNDEIFHHQVGYWLWDASKKLVMQSFTIPRGVALVAGGVAVAEDETIVIEVAAGGRSAEWPIAQSPFMLDKARTLAFDQQLTLRGDCLHYRETTLLDIYGKSFEHTDQNELLRMQ